MIGVLEEETLCEAVPEAFPKSSDEKRSDSKFGGDDEVLGAFFEYAQKQPLLKKQEEQKLGKEMLLACACIRRIMRKIPPKIRRIAIGKNIVRKLRVELPDRQALEDFTEGLERFLVSHGENKVLHGYAKEARKAFGRYEAAYDHMVRSNFLLIPFVARIYSTSGMSLADRVQEGSIGLMRAVEKFDYRKDARFSTYAFGWIRQAITRALADKHRTIRIPVHLGDKIRRIKREMSFGNGMTEERAAKKLGISRNMLEVMQKVPVDPVPFGDLGGKEHEGDMAGQIEDTKTVSPEELVAERERKEMVKELFSLISPREALVLYLRYGLDGDTHTLSEVGKRIGVTRERVRQIQIEAETKIKRIMQLNPRYRDCVALLR